MTAERQRFERSGRKLTRPLSEETVGATSVSLLLPAQLVGCGSV